MRADRNRDLLWLQGIDSDELLADAYRSRYMLFAGGLLLESVHRIQQRRAQTIYSIDSFNNQQ